MMRLQSGHTVSEVSDEEQAIQEKHFKANGLGTIRLYPDGWFFLKSFTKFADKLFNFKINSSDVFVMTFPKCGTTWTQEIVWTMRNNPDLNHPMAQAPVNVRCPFIEWTLNNDYHFMMKDINSNEFGDYLMMNPYLLTIMNSSGPHPMTKLNIEDGIFFQMGEHMEGPRTMKVHLPLSLMPKKLLDTSKVIYVVRNPKDVCISYHHHCRLIKGHDYVGTLDQFIDHFINDTLLYSPFWPHVKEAWNKRDHPNMHFMFYEQLKANPKQEIQRLNSFLATNLTEKQMENIAQYTSFDVMKARENLMGSDDPSAEELHFNKEVLRKDGGFFRKGQAGDFKTKLTISQKQKLDLWTQANTIGTGLKFES